MAVQIKRDLEENRAGYTPAEGELIYTTDNKLVYIGDGGTSGGKLIGPESITTSDSVNGFTSVGINASKGNNTWGGVMIGVNAGQYIGEGPGNGGGGGNVYVGGFAGRNTYSYSHHTVIGFAAGRDLGSNIGGDLVKATMYYEIIDPGTFDFTTIGAADSNSGTRFTATGPADASATVRHLGHRNVIIGREAGSVDGFCKQLDKSIMIGADTKGLNPDSYNEIIIGNAVQGKGWNTTTIGTSETTQTWLGGKLLIDKVPSADIGAEGDKAGMIASDASYLYHCNADYDGTTAIWGRLAITSW